jgi:hypothetical protein
MVATAAESSSPPTWRPWHFWAFRTVFIYLLLFFAVQFNILFIESSVNRLARWAALSLLHVALPDNPLEALTDYLVVWLDVGFAITAALIWGQLERKRPELSRRFTSSLFWPTHTALRYFLASTLFVYGWQKVFSLQMPALGLSDMLVPFGEQRKMSLLWHAVGSAPLFEMVGGLAEVVPACLLLFRRSSLLGALLAAFVLGFVVLLNLSFNIHVKLWSIHLFAFSLLLLTPYLGNVSRLLSNRPTQPVVVPGVPAHAWQRWTGWAWRLVAVGYLVLVPLGSQWAMRDRWRMVPANFAISGLYEVISDSRPAPAQLTQDHRWRRVAFNDARPSSVSSPYFLIQRVNQEKLQGKYDVVTGAHAVRLSVYSAVGKSLGQLGLRYQRGPSGTLTISGEEAGQPFTVQLQPSGALASRVRDETFGWVSTSWLLK